VTSSTRRDFLLGGMATLGAMSAAPPKRVNKMRFGFTSYQWGTDWDVPTTIANCTKAKAFGVELRTQEKYAAGVEVSLPDAQRREIRKQFADSPVKMVGLACSEKYDWIDPDKLKQAIESTRAHLKLSHDIGGGGLRVFVNDWHREVPHEKTIEQVAGALNTVGKIGAGYGQLVRLENHGSAGDLVTIRKIMDGVTQKNVRIKLNGLPADAPDFANRFQLVKNILDNTLHFHELGRGDFPYQLQSDLLIDAGWDGWWLLEASSKVPDRMAGLIAQHELFDKMVAASLNR
jgi:sugar phosphate isomerase/epimerase